MTIRGLPSVVYISPCPPCCRSCDPARAEIKPSKQTVLTGARGPAHSGHGPIARSGCAHHRGRARIRRRHARSPSVEVLPHLLNPPTDCCSSPRASMTARVINCCIHCPIRITETLYPPINEQKPAARPGKSGQRDHYCTGLAVLVASGLYRPGVSEPGSPPDHCTETCS